MKEDIKKTVVLNIRNFNFSIETDKDTLYINKLEKFINEQLIEAEKTSVSTVEVYVNACLMIADKYFTLIEEQKHELNLMNNKFTNIVNFIEDRIS